MAIGVDFGSFSGSKFQASVMAGMRKRTDEGNEQRKNLVLKHF